MTLASPRRLGSDAIAHLIASEAVAMRTVGKLIILKFEGDFERQGFRVSLEMSHEGDRPFLEASGALPANPELVAYLNQWQQAYRSLDVASRIEPKEIVYGGSIQQVEACRRWAKDLGHSLTRWLSSDAFAAIDRRLREALSLHEPIRILIRTEDPNLRHLPWHLWDLIDRYTEAEVGFCASIAQRIQVRALSPDGKVRVLAILGNSSGIDIQSDRQLLASLPNASVQFLVEPRRQEINDRLWNQPWDILFFAGHSETKTQQGRIFINDRESLTLDELRYGLRQAIAQGLRLAIFNSCDGLGLVSQLEQVHLPCAIAMREPVPDRIAQEFLKQFLIAFAAGDSLYLAVRRSRERLQGWEGDFPCASWLPVICQNASESPSTWQSLRGATQSPPVRKPIDRFGRLKKLLLIATLVTSVIMGVRSIGWLQSFELRAFDQLVQQRPAEAPDDRILIISVSEADIQYQDQMGMERQGSLSDRALRQVLQRLQPYQPRAIGLDIYHDFAFAPDLAQVLAKTPEFVAICKVNETAENPAIAPPPDLAPEQLGFSDWVTDADGIVRRQLLGMTSSQTCPTSQALSLRLALRYLEQSNLPLQRNAAQEVVIGNVRFPKLAHHAGGYQLMPTKANGYQILLNYRSAAPAQIALRDLLNGSLDSQIDLRDRIILIGVTTENVDVHRTPYQSQLNWRTAGVVIHAQMISQVISAVLDRRPLLWWWPEWAECLWIGGWSIAGGALALGWSHRRDRSLLRLGLTVMLSLGLLSGCCFLVLLQGGWLSIVAPAIALLASAVAAAIWSSTQNTTLYESDF